MAIVRWNDPVSISPTNLWQRMWIDEDLWPEERDGLSVYETDNEVIAQANVPGIPADKVDVSYEGGVLSIKAENEEKKEEKRGKKVISGQERRDRYYYTTSIPYAVKQNKIDAEVRDGVVYVTMPKEEKAKPKKIKVHKA
jgi:HSP20 family protein